MDTLTKLSTSTAILDDANCLGELAESSLSIDDPTNVSSTAEHIVKQQQAKKNMSTSSATSTTFHSSTLWNNFASASGQFYPKTK